MTRLFFAEDGSYGDASEMLIVDLDDRRWSDERLTALSEASDSHRIDVAYHFVNIDDGDEEHFPDEDDVCRLCGLKGADA
jgi:hypothetical protein